MKKIFFAILLMFLPMLAKAEAVEINGIYYNLIKKGKIAEVTENPNGYKGWVIIPESITHEGIDYSVTSIGESAFLFSDLSSVTIPKSITSIGKTAFGGSQINSIYISDISAWCMISFSNSWINSDHHLFLNGEEIKELVIPNNVTSISSRAFLDCGALTSIAIPNSIISIGESAFEGCYKLTTMTIPNSVTSIGGYAFYRCTGLASVTISNNLTRIEECVFYNCSGLKSITIPNSVKSIGKMAFGDCVRMTSLTISNNVREIGEHAFYGCTGLKKVIIPNSILSISSGAFGNCTDLTDVYCYAENVPSTKNDAFKESYIEYVTLHVPSSSISAYKAANPWKNFKQVVAIEGGSGETKKCVKPTINYNNGELSFYSETEGVEYIYEITDIDVKKGYDAKVKLGVTYNITVYATKSGYDNSDLATATLCWIEAAPQTEGISNGIAQLAARPAMIQNSNGTLYIQGVEDGTSINVYDANGTQVGFAISSNGQATVNTILQTGSVAIIKIGSKSVKVVMK